MQDTLLSEKKKDEEIYEKMSCWCEVNDKEKTASVAAAERAIDQLTSTIEEKTELSAQLKGEIEGLEAEMAKAKEAIDTATAMREEEKAEFTTEEKELLDTVDALTRAVEVLGKHHSFLQVEATLKRMDLGRMEGMKAKALALLKAPTGGAAKSYNSRSGEIFGILQQMKETFEQDLSKEQQQEKEAQARFEELIAEKKRGIEVARERKNTKVTELSESEIALVNAKHDLKNTRKDLSADQKFLVDMKEKCSASDKEFEQRKKDREEEILAIGDALKILTEVSAQLDAFTKVKAAIDEMITELKKQQEDEVQHKRWCNDELRKNEVEHKEKSWKFEDLTKANNVLADTIETLDSEMKA